MRRAFVASMCVLLAGVLPALAQERIREERGGPSVGEIRKGSVLIGSKVTIREGESLGEVVDLVINDSGCIDFMVVRYEDDYIAVPWSVTTFNVQRRAVVLNTSITRAKLRDVTFTRDRWPNFYGGAFSRSLSTVWGERALRHDHRGGAVEPREGRRDVRPEDRRPADRRPDRTPPPPRRDRPPNPTPPQPPQG